MEKIVFFDGVCVMCNGLVDFVLKHDHKQLFRFAPLQGETARAKIPELASDLSTIVLIDEHGIATESDAIIGILRALGGFFRMATILKIVPKAMRDRTYRYVAQNRYRWFGKHESCRLPSKEERARILD